MHAGVRTVHVGESHTACDNLRGVDPDKFGEEERNLPVPINQGAEGGMEAE